MTILPLSRPAQAGQELGRELARRLALPVLVLGLVLCCAGYLGLAALLLHALL